MRANSEMAPPVNRLAAEKEMRGNGLHDPDDTTFLPLAMQPELRYSCVFLRHVIALLFYIANDSGT